MPAPTERPGRRVDHLRAAQSILARDSEDLGDHELAEATAHALTAAAEHLENIARLINARDSA